MTFPCALARCSCRSVSLGEAPELHPILSTYADEGAIQTVPELPEVETMRRGILAVEGSLIKDVELPDCRLKPLRVTPGLSEFQHRVRDVRIARVERLGKRVVMRLATGDAVVFEPRMTGLVLLADPPNQEHLRFIMKLRSRRYPQLLYWDRRGLGAVQLLEEEELRQLSSEKLGPDALVIDQEDLRRRLKTSRRAIKVALLDQSAVAGIGNIYASEILHLAGVHPAARCDRLSRVQWTAIYDAMREVLSEAVKYEGSTLADGTYRNALNVAGDYQNHHRVYDREGRVCHRCGAIIQRTVQVQRATFFCPGCQWRRKTSTSARVPSARP